MEAQNNNQPINRDPPMPQPTQMISAAEWAAKFPSKRETYHFLAFECDVYLPPIGKCLTIILLMQFLIQRMSPCTS